MSRKSSDFMIEQQVMLGGKASRKYKDYIDIARISPDYAELNFFISHFDEWEKEQDELKVIMQIFDYLGMCDFVRFADQLTRLSMIVSDERESTNVREIMDDLRKSRSNSPT